MQGMNFMRGIFKAKWRVDPDKQHIEYDLPTRDVDITIAIWSLSTDQRVNLFPTQSQHIWYHDVQAHEYLYQLIAAAGLIPHGELRYRHDLRYRNVSETYTTIIPQITPDSVDIYDDDDNEQPANHLEKPTEEQHRAANYYYDDDDQSYHHNDEQNIPIDYYDDDQSDYYHDDYQLGYYYNEEYILDQNEPTEYYNHDSTDLHYYHADDNSPDSPTDCYHEDDHYADDNAYYEDDHYEDDNSYSEDDNSADWTECSESN
jgi:hypothetical protein